MTTRKSSMSLDEEVRKAREAYLDAAYAWEELASDPVVYTSLHGRGRPYEEGSGETRDGEGDGGGTSMSRLKSQLRYGQGMWPEAKEREHHHVGLTMAAKRRAETVLDDLGKLGVEITSTRPARCAFARREAFHRGWWAPSSSAMAI